MDKCTGVKAVQDPHIDVYADFATGIGAILSGELSRDPTAIAEEVRKLHEDLPARLASATAENRPANPEESPQKQKHPRK